MNNHKEIKNYLYLNGFFSNQTKILHIKEKFNIPIKNNLLYIEDQDLQLIIEELNSEFNTINQIINLLLITNFTNFHILYIDKIYKILKKQEINEFLNQSNDFKPQLESLITLKNLIGEKRYGES